MTLDNLRQLEAEATPGPWKATATGCLVVASDEDANLIAQSRNALPLLLDAIEAAKKGTRNKFGACVVCWNRTSHDDGCPFAAFDSALAALEGQ